MSLRVAYIGINSESGNELAEGVKYIIENKKLIFETPDVNDSYAYRNICIEYDIVILDASIEETHNYRFAMPFPADFILVVSRTSLPLNFYGLRDATLNKESNKLLYNSPLLTNDKNLKNKDLIEWLRHQIDDLIKIYRNNPEVINTQKDFFKKPLSNIASLLLNFKKTPKGWNTESERRQKSGQIFISFRNISVNGKSVIVDRLNEVKKLVENGKFLNLPKKTVRFFPPNSLSNEIMSGHRRWQILSMIDRFIGPAEEVWIFEIEHEEALKKCDINPENYYYNSWWTLGELLTLSYRGLSDYIDSVPRIKILKYKDGQYSLENAPSDILPVMKLEHRKRMARWYANCDPSQMAPESVLAIRATPEIPVIGFLFKKMNYFNDPVWSEEFWETPILDCGKCRCIGKNGHRFEVDDFLWTKGDWYTRIPKELISANKPVMCQNCGTKYKVKREEEPHFFWIPPMSRDIVGEYYLTILGFEDEITEDYDYSLVKIPVYTIENE